MTKTDRRTLKKSQYMWKYEPQFIELTRRIGNNKRETVTVSLETVLKKHVFALGLDNLFEKGAK